MMIKDKNFIHINNKCVGILSLRTPNEWNLNIAIEAQDSHNNRIFIGHHTREKKIHNMFDERNISGS
jgi:hypothetical protein